MGWRKQIVSKRVSSDAAVEEEFLSKRSEKYKTVTKSPNNKADNHTHSLWQRLYDVVYKGYMPRGFTLSDKETWRILGLAGLIMFKVYAADGCASRRCYTCNRFGKLKINFRLSLVAGYLLPYVSGCVRCNYDPSEVGSEHRMAPTTDAVYDGSLLPATPSMMSKIKIHGLRIPREID